MSYFAVVEYYLYAISSELGYGWNIFVVATEQFTTVVANNVIIFDYHFSPPFSLHGQSGSWVSLSF